MGAEDVLGLMALVIEGALLLIVVFTIQWCMDEDKDKDDEEGKKQ